MLTVDAEHHAYLAGHRLFSGDLDDLMQHLDTLLPASRPMTLVTPNVDQSLLMRRDADMRDAVARADLLTVDGAPLVLLGRAIGARHLHRITGADLLPAITAHAAGRGQRVVVTGGAPGTSELAAEHLRESTGADIVSVPFPHITGTDDPAGSEVVATLKALAPDVVFVCLGAPKQEAWIAHWMESLPPALYVGAGAAVDFAAGVRRRAPRAVQAVGAEWLFRLLQEPRRLARRYLVRGPLFLLIAARSAAVAIRERA